jgi:hypothetical protein
LSVLRRTASGFPYAGIADEIEPSDSEYATSESKHETAWIHGVRGRNMKSRRTSDHGSVRRTMMRLLKYRYTQALVSIGFKDTFTHSCVPIRDRRSDRETSKMVIIEPIEESNS